MGGGGGTSVAATAMQGLPLGFPKVCISTLASGNTQEYVGTKDIVLFPSIVDICGINRFSRMIMSRAAGAVCGMVELDPIISQNDKPVIAISLWRNLISWQHKTRWTRKSSYSPFDCSRLS